MRTLKIVTVLLFALGALLLAASSPIVAPTAVEAESRNATQNRNGVDASRYVGSDSCAQCHADQAAHYALTAHAKTQVGNKNGATAGVDKIGCESCHGGAKLHVEYYTEAQRLIKEGKEDAAQALYADEAKSKAAQLRQFDKLAPAEASATCLRCHEGTQGRNDERFNYRRSEHARHGVSCNDCHSSHAPKRTEFLLKASEPNMCYTCHAEQKASFAKPFHHKVPEGGMKCSDCHNQHGGFMLKSLRNSVNGDQMCVRCHADKQGPFVYEHAPVKVEGCQSCHTPHGSTNPKLLSRNIVRFLCLECHSNTPGIPDTDGIGIGPGTPSFHDINNPRYANCTVCHIEIHGSNKDPFFR